MDAKVDNKITVPLPLDVKDIKKAHGTQGWLMVRLQRYTLLGWGLFISLLLIFILYVFVSRINIPIVAVDESGNVLGHFEYLSPKSRTNGELIAAAIEFNKYFISVNSDSIYDDFASALNMMDEGFRNKQFKKAVDENYINQIANKNTTSSNIYAEKSKRPQVIYNKDFVAKVQLRGRQEITIKDLKTYESTSIERLFDLTIIMRIVNRSRFATVGVKVIDVINN